MTELINKPRPTLTVLYDGACPLCRREIGVYQGLQPVHAAQTLSFSDISRVDSALPPGGVRSDYLARFHVQRCDGRVISGAAAFVALWATLPDWRYLAMVARCQVLRPFLKLCITRSAGPTSPAAWLAATYMVQAGGQWVKCGGGSGSAYLIISDAIFLIAAYARIYWL